MYSCLFVTQILKLFCIPLQAIQVAAHSAQFVGARAANPLPEATSAWVASKRVQLTKLMWQAAGIVRNTDDLKVALQQLAELYVEARALSEVLSPLPAQYLRKYVFVQCAETDLLCDL